MNSPILSKNKRLWLSFAAALALLSAAPVTAQDSGFEVRDLSAATPLMPGVLTRQQGGLSPLIWAGTDKALAEQLLADAPLFAKDPAINRLVQRVLLSEAEPPAGANNDPAFSALRIGRIWEAGYGDAARSILRRTSIQNNPKLLSLQADMALLAGEMDEACYLMDGVQNGRDEPYWQKLRAFCLLRRDQIPAAELTVDRLRQSGHRDKPFFDLFDQAIGLRTKDASASADSALTIAMAQSLETGASIDLAGAPRVYALAVARSDHPPIEYRFKALARAGAQADTRTLVSILDAAWQRSEEARLEDYQSGGSETELAGATPDETGPLPGEFDFPEPDYAAAIAVPTMDNIGDLYDLIAQPGNHPLKLDGARAMMQFADSQNLRPVFTRLVQSAVKPIPARDRMVTDAPLFVRLAFEADDRGDLMGLRDALPEEHELRRKLDVALAVQSGQISASDLDFVSDLSAASTERSAFARRALFVLPALGVTPDAQTRRILMVESLDADSELTLSERLSLQWAGDGGHGAEAALLVAGLIGDRALQDIAPADMAAMVGSLYEAGLYEDARHIAARYLLGL